MEVTQLIPETGAIPIPWGWFEALSILTLVLHLLLMNTLVGGGVITLVNHLRSGGSSLIGRDMKNKLPVLMAFTVNFGIAPLLFVQVLYGSFIYTSQILMAFYVMGIIAMLIIGYYAIYIYRGTFTGEGSSAVWPLVVALLAILGTGFVFVNIMTMMLNPGQWTAWFDQANGSLLATGDATFWPKFLHMINGALAVGGLFIALLWHFKPAGTEKRKEHIALGLDWFKYATLIQFLVGLWFFLSLPSFVQGVYLGGNALATTALALAILLAAGAVFFAFRRNVLLTLGAALLTVVLMVITRAFMRASYLDQVNYSPASLPVTGELSSFILFAVTLVIGLALAAWMLLTYSKVQKEA